VVMKWRKLLTYHKRLVQRYLDRRQRQCGNRKPIRANRQYSRFQTLADDRLELLDGVIANIDQQTSP
jgi:hypothetical protein